MTSPQFTNDNWHIVCSSPANYIGAAVEVFGKVFGGPNQGTDGVALEIMVDWEHFLQHTVVHYLYSQGLQGAIVPRLTDGDYLEVKGALSDPIVTTNLFGTQNSLPCIRANHLVKTSPNESIRDGRTVVIKQEEAQHGVVVVAEKLVIRLKETDIFVKIRNEQTKDMAYFYELESKIKLGNHQYEAKYEKMNKYGSFPDKILPNVEVGGILAFAPLGPRIRERGSFQLYLFAGSDNYEAEFKPFIFNISW